MGATAAAAIAPCSRLHGGMTSRDPRQYPSSPASPFPLPAGREPPHRQPRRRRWTLVLLL